MPAYMVVSAIIPDRDAFLQSGYPEAAGALMARYGGEYVLRGPGAQLLEGDWGERASVVVTRWPDKATALRYWHSDEYQAARRLRAGLGEMRILLIEQPA